MVSHGVAIVLAKESGRGNHGGRGADPGRWVRASRADDGSAAVSDGSRVRTDPAERVIREAKVDVWCRRQAVLHYIIRGALTRLSAMSRWAPTSGPLADGLTKDEAGSIDMLRARVRR